MNPHYAAQQATTETQHQVLETSRPASASLLPVIVVVSLDTAQSKAEAVFKKRPHTVRKARLCLENKNVPTTDPESITTYTLDQPSEGLLPKLPLCLIVTEHVVVNRLGGPYLFVSGVIRDKKLRLPGRST